MAAYNSKADLLKETIESILNQTFSDFEFLIVDDGSKEPLEPIIKTITRDERVVVYRKENTGLGSSLTYGIRKAKGEYIARIDDDDVSVKDRIEKQVIFLDTHPEVSCVGGHIYYRYGDKIYPHTPFPLTHERIIAKLVKMHFAMAHTTLMYRKDDVERIGCYRIPKGNEDLDLLLQLGTVGKLANIDEYLTYYRLTHTGLSVTSPQKAKAYTYALESALRYKGYSPNYDDIKSSLGLLQKGDKKNFLNKLFPSRRFFLIWMVQLFGKNFNHMETQFNK